MIARFFKAIGWSALIGFATGVCTYLLSALITAGFGPIFYNLSLTDHVGRALIFGIGGLVILGAAFLISYLVWLRARPPAAAIFTLAVVAFVVQSIELGAMEALAIRSAHALSWPIADQLVPLNISIFASVGNWEGRPDAAFFWFSTALIVFVFAAWFRRLGAQQQ